MHGTSSPNNAPVIVPFPGETIVPIAAPIEVVKIHTEQRVTFNPVCFQKSAPSSNAIISFSVLAVRYAICRRRNKIT